jgi:hypothetical protein
MARYVSAIPAYGRDYKTQKEVREAWERGEDFNIQDMFVGGYVNKDDKPDDIVLNIRYSRGARICVVK